MVLFLVVVIVLSLSVSFSYALSNEFNLFGTERVLINDDDANLGYNKTELCKQADEATASQCYLKGNYCYFGSSTRNVTYTTSTLIGEQTNVIQCENASAINYMMCPFGYYCPDNTTLTSCPRGYFCYAGSIEPTRCTFDLAACPLENTKQPSKGVYFILFLLILFGCMITYIAYIKRSLLKDMVQLNHAIETEHLYHEESVISEQELYLNNLMFLCDLSAERVKNVFTEYKTLSNNSKKGYEKNDIELEANINDTIQIIKPQVNVGSVVKLMFSSNIVNSSQDKVYQSKMKTFIKSKKFQQFMYNMKESRRRSASVYTSNGHFHFSRVPDPLYVSFDNLNLNLKKSGTPILKEVFGKVSPFTITALMGSSGAGKTTLLSLLRGQAHFATTSGHIYVNGNEVESLVPFRDLMGFVPQDDIMYDDLTVEDNIVYSAILFNKRGFTTKEEVLPMVIYVMDLLGITFIRNSIVGSPEIKGISGGQKKRVSVAMELMKEPSFFLLDEPTSGLDAATSISLLTSLHNLSDLGVNIVATLHQPRQEIFDLINNLCLLAPGGRVAYMGPAFDLSSYMYKLGYECHPGSNVADFAMDVIAGFVCPKWSKTVPPVKVIIKTICDFYHENYHENFVKELEYIKNKKLIIENVESKKSLWNTVVSVENQNYCDSTFVNTVVKIFYKTFIIPLYTSFSRQVKQYHRNWSNVSYCCQILVVLGLIVGILFGDICINPDNGKAQIESQICSSQLVYALVLQSSALKLILNDSTMRTREETGGIRLLPLYLGKLFGGSLEFIIYPFAYCVGYYSMIVPRGFFGQYWVMFLLLHMAVSGLCNFIAVFIGGKNASLIASGAIVVFWSFGGITPTKATLEERMGNFGTLMNSLSMFSPSFNLALRYELVRYTDAWNVVTDKYKAAYQIDSFDTSPYTSALIAYWIISNTLAYLWLEYKRDDFRLWRLFSTKYGIDKVIVCVISTYAQTNQFLSRTQDRLIGCLMNCTTSCNFTRDDLRAKREVDGISFVSVNTK